MPDKKPVAEARPFLPFVAGPRNKQRKRAGGGGVRSRENAAEHGQNILRQIEAFQEIVNTQVARRPSGFPTLPEPIQAIVEAERLPVDRVSALGLTPIEERADGLLVAVSPTAALPTLATKAQSYITERTGSENPRYEGLIAPIDHIRPATREDKIGERLAMWLAEGKWRPDDLIWVDIELAGGRSEQGQENRQQFYDYVHELNAWLPAYAQQVVTATSQFMVEEDYSIHRVLLPVQAVEDLLDNSRANWLLLIDLITEIEDQAGLLPETADGKTPELPQLPQDAPRVVVVDSGIRADHPLFQNDQGRTIIGRQVNFLPEPAEPPDLTTDEIEGGHGTAVASVVAYGSLKAARLSQAGAEPPRFWIENAKIMLPASKLDASAPAHQPRLHPAQMPKGLMREIVASFHQPLPNRCKIFNLSAGGAPHHLRSISNWAEEMDNLSARNDILFVVSAGSLDPAQITRMLEEVGGYPGYLLDQRARLREPGQAHTALTVGAITDKDVPLPPFKTEPFLAPTDFPAPFSRSGLLKGTIIKPDVVEVGGNLTYAPDRELKALPEASVLVAGSNSQPGQSLGFRWGSGLAAARVSHLAGQIQARYPQASANLIRALVVNSAEWPEGFRNSFGADDTETLSKETGQQILRLCGYGVPQADKALAANARCMVFVAEDEFSWIKNEANKSRRYPAKVSFFEIRFEPDDLFRLPPATRIRVSVTLAYNPPVRKTQRRHYQGLQIRWDLKRRDETSEEFWARWMAEAALGENNEEDGQVSKARPWPWQLKPVVNPGGRLRRGTVVRDWFDISIQDLPQTLEIVAMASVAPWLKPPEPLAQRFALVVSVESLDQKIPIYDLVRVQQPAEPA